MKKISWFLLLFCFPNFSSAEIIYCKNLSYIFELQTTSGIGKLTQTTTDDFSLIFSCKKRLQDWFCCSDSKELYIFENLNGALNATLIPVLNTPIFPWSDFMCGVRSDS
jgi:hypothetical protein